MAACTPALNWREVRTEGGALTTWMPCKPERRVRTLELGGASVRMEVLGCHADGSTWGLTSADVGEAARVGPALAQLRRARSENLGAPEASAETVQLAGTSPPTSTAVKLKILGRHPEGGAVVEHGLLFSSGTRVFYVAVLGRDQGSEALDNFLGQLRLAR